MKVQGAEEVLTFRDTDSIVRFCVNNEFRSDCPLFKLHAVGLPSCVTYSGAHAVAYNSIPARSLVVRLFPQEPALELFDSIAAASKEDSDGGQGGGGPVRKVSQFVRRASRHLKEIQQQAELIERAAAAKSHSDRVGNHSQSFARFWSQPPSKKQN